MAPDREPEEKDILQKKLLLISTPAGGRYIIDFDQLQAIINKEGGMRSSELPGLYKVFAKKIGDNQMLHYFLPLGVSDISSYSEPVPETEPVGRATVEESSSEKLPFEVSGY